MTLFRKTMGQSGCVCFIRVCVYVHFFSLGLFWVLACDHYVLVCVSNRIVLCITPVHSLFFRVCFTGVVDFCQSLVLSHCSLAELLFFTPVLEF